jgi:hypothetical protein
MINTIIVTSGLNNMDKFQTLLILT